MERGLSAPSRGVFPWKMIPCWHIPSINSANSSAKVASFFEINTKKWSKWPKTVIFVTFSSISPRQGVGFGYNSKTLWDYVSFPGPIIFMANASTSLELWAWDCAQTAGLLLICCICCFKLFSVSLITPHQSIGFGCYFVVMGRNITLTCHISFMVSAQTSPELYACAWA